MDRKNLVFLEKMDLKIPKVVDSNKIGTTKSFLVQKYLDFQNLLDFLKTEWPDTHVTIMSLIHNRTSYLESRFLTDESKQPSAIIKAELEKLEKDIVANIPSLKKTHLELITWGVIADWLIRCPLDF